MFYETGPATVEAMQLEGGLDALAGIYAAGSAIKRPNTVHEVAAVALDAGPRRGQEQSPPVSFPATAERCPTELTVLYRSPRSQR